MLHSTDQQKCILYPKDKLLGHFIWRKKRLHDLSIHVPEKTHSYENHTYPPSQIKATFTLVFEKMCWSVTQWNLVSERKLDRQKLQRAFVMILWKPCSKIDAFMVIFGQFTKNLHRKKKLFCLYRNCNFPYLINSKKGRILAISDLLEIIANAIASIGTFEEVFCHAFYYLFYKRLFFFFVVF